MNMKTKLIISALCLSSLAGMKAQVADQQIGDLLNNADWFALDEAYPKVKDQIQTPIIKGLSETMLSFYFNQPERALSLIDSLLANSQDQLGFGNISNLVLMKSVILGDQGQYAKSADDLNNFLDQVTAFASKTDFPGHLEIVDLYGPLRSQPAPTITRPDKDVEVTVSFEKAGKGELMFIPVTAGGRQHSFIFDTGASASLVSERFAKEIGIRIIQDSVTIAGIQEGTSRVGTIDSLVVGEMVFRYPLIYVAPANPTIDTLYQIDAVFGSDLIRLAGETRIFPSAGKIVFPHKQSPQPSTGRNLLLQNKQPYLKASSNGDRLVFHFDTGNARTSMFAPYYQKYKTEIEATGVKETIRGGGFGGIFEVEGYRLPKISLTVGSVSAVLPDISVATQSADALQRQEDGSIGADFLKQFGEVIINFDKMFLQVSK